MEILLWINYQRIKKVENTIKVLAKCNLQRKQ